MARKKKQFQIKQTLSSAHAARLQRRGWQLSGQYLDAMSGLHSYTLVRPNPRYGGEGVDPASLLHGADHSVEGAESAEGARPAKSGEDWHFRW